MLSVPAFLEQRLNVLNTASNLRSFYRPEPDLEDFSSNDYLGLSRNKEIKEQLLDRIRYADTAMGATGSRLLTGNSAFSERLETEIANHHLAESALFLASGYTANLSIFSCLPQKNDTVITDDCIHASVIDGCRLSHAKRFHFRHNDTSDLERKIKKATGNCFVAIESLYSMEGDIAPLEDIIVVCKKHGAFLIVDEAHAAGVFGMGLVQQLHFEKDVFARVITYGKAFGTHGASILGSSVLKNYLINHARPFIYATAPSYHQLHAVDIAYNYLNNNQQTGKKLFENIALFKSLMPDNYLTNPGPIQLVPVKGNESVMSCYRELTESGLNVMAVRSPSVPPGKERLRICLHNFNTAIAITTLCHQLNKIISPL